MWFGVKGIGHVATSGTQSREVICQICKSNKLLPGITTNATNRLYGRNRQRRWLHSLSRISILAFTFLANRHSTTPDECANCIRSFRPSS